MVAVFIMGAPLGPVKWTNLVCFDRKGTYVSDVGCIASFSDYSPLVQLGLFS
jgi:hypothetical protein